MANRISQKIEEANEEDENESPEKSFESDFDLVENSSFLVQRCPACFEEHCGCKSRDAHVFPTVQYMAELRVGGGLIVLH